MNSTQLNCFLAVADSLSFARASERLHITQPAVTHQINSLESELGVKLFKRTTRTVELTKEGFSFITDAKSILNTMAMAKMRFAVQEKIEPAPFFIGCGLRELVFLPDLIHSMFIKYPNLHPYTKTIPFPALMSQLQNESIDVLFGLQGMTKPRQNCRFLELTKAPIVCAMPKGHPLSSQKKIEKRSSQSAHRCVGYFKYHAAGTFRPKSPDIRPPSRRPLLLRNGGRNPSSRKSGYGHHLSAGYPSHTGSPFGLCASCIGNFRFLWPLLQNLTGQIHAPGFSENCFGLFWRLLSVRMTD